MIQRWRRQGRQVTGDLGPGGVQSEPSYAALSHLQSVWGAGKISACNGSIYNFTWFAFLSLEHC